MKILINDLPKFRETYIQMFTARDYEENELIFLSSFQDSKEFIANYLNTKKLHIDAIITNDTSYTYYDSLKATELCSLKNSTINSYSNCNFRICSIPIIMYSENDTKYDLTANNFNAIIQKNTSGYHDYFLDQCESIIKSWRKSLYDDLENLKIEFADLPLFHHSNFFNQYYRQNISAKAEEYFSKTKIVSLEFIRLPNKLCYDWMLLNNDKIENSLLKYIETYKDHVKYDRRNNERTILHDFFKKNRLILLRDVYADMQYETNLYELNTKNSEECDFILKTEYPEFLKTTFFEVKKEDVKLFVKRNNKRPRFSADFFRSSRTDLWVQRILRESD